MKKYILLVMIIGGWCWGCQEEDAIHAELGSDGRTYDTTSSDPVVKYISSYYYKYDRTILFDPDTTDYIYNFQNKNNFRIAYIEKERWGKTLDVLRELFLDSYSPKAVKTCLPFAILVLDSIKSKGVWDMNYKYVDQYSSTGFIAFAIDKGDLALTEQGKYDRSLKMHLEFLSVFGVAYGRWEHLSNAFYNVSKKYYGSTDEKDVFPTIEQAYAVGFTKVIRGGWWGACPARTEDLQLWIEFVLKTPEAEMATIIATYDAMKVKYNAIVEAFTEMGIDYKSLVYKKKNL